MASHSAPKFHSTTTDSDVAVSERPLLEEVTLTPNSDEHRYAEVSSPVPQPSHTAVAEKETAHPSDKEVVQKPVEKEAVYDAENEKEVYINDASELSTARNISRPPKVQKRILGVSRRWFLVGTAILILVVIILAVVLGVVLSRHHNTVANSPNSNYTIGGALNPSYYSQSGAFNGSGVASSSADFGASSTVITYYQHYTGDIRAQIQAPDGTFNNSVLIVATDARNGTPIAAVAYLVNAVENWNLFYIDSQGLVRQKQTTNATVTSLNYWADGPLSNLKLQANNADLVGLQACYWGNIYGDLDFTNAGGVNASNTFDPAFGMHLWYSDTDTSFQQYSWVLGDSQWNHDNETWQDINARAGIGCYTWALLNDISYIGMVDLHNNINLFWKDSNSSAASTSDHPINQWVNTSIVIPNVHPSTSIGYTDFLVFQATDNSIRGYNISWAAENTTFATNPDGSTNSWDNTNYQGFVVTNATTGEFVYGLPGTHFSFTSQFTADFSQKLDLLFQVKGNDISGFTRDVEGGAWNNAGQVPISD